jgi:hypothetical protein
VEKHTEKRLFQRSRKWKDDLNMNLIKMDCEPGKWMELVDFGTSDIRDLGSDILNYFLNPCRSALPLIMNAQCGLLWRVFDYNDYNYSEYDVVVISEGSQCTKWLPCLRIFLSENGLSVKDIHTEMLSVYGGMCLSRRAVHSWVEKFSQLRSKVADDARSCAEVAETTVKRLPCCGFLRTDKGIWQAYNVGGGYVEIEMFFPGSNITCFTFYINLCPIYWLSLVSVRAICTLQCEDTFRVPVLGTLTLLVSSWIRQVCEMLL